MRPILIFIALSACAPATATLQAQCAGFGYTDSAALAQCTERGHRAATERQLAVMRTLIASASANIAIGSLAGAVAGMDMPDIEIAAPTFTGGMPK